MRNFSNSNLQDVVVELHFSTSKVRIIPDNRRKEYKKRLRSELLPWL
jgi:hypothetical protein